MKFSVDVLFLHSPEEAFQEQPGDREEHLPFFHLALFADSVDRLHRHVLHSEVVDIELHEDVVRLAVTLVHPIPVDELERELADGGEAALRISDVPVSGSDLREEGKAGVSDEPGDGDLPIRALGDEPVRL